MPNENYLAIPTNLGLTKIQQATWAQVPLTVVYLGYGDGGGSTYTPDPAQTDLKNRLDTVELQNIVVDTASGVTWFEALIASTNANGVIREIGLYTATMELIAIANTPEIHKVNVASGALMDIPISLGMKNSIANNIVIPIQPSEEFASKNWVYLAIQNIVEIDCGSFDPPLSNT